MSKLKLAKLLTVPASTLTAISFVHTRKLTDVQVKASFDLEVCVIVRIFYEFQLIHFFLSLLSVCGFEYV